MFNWCTKAVKFRRRKRLLHCSKFGKLVKYQKCFACDDWDGSSRGLGDFIASVTKFFGIKPCGGCLKRRKAFNKKVPTKKGKEMR